MGEEGKIVAGFYFSSALQKRGGSVVQLDKAKTRAKGRKKRRANEIGLRILRIRDFKVQIMKQVMGIDSKGDQHSRTQSGKASVVKGDGDYENSQRNNIKKMIVHPNTRFSLRFCVRLTTATSRRVMKTKRRQPPIHMSIA